MTTTKEVRKNAQRAAEICELAKMGLVMNLGVKTNEAAQMLLVHAAKTLTAAEIKQALSKVGAA